MRAVTFYQEEFLNYLKSFKTPSAPNSLYEPIDYILNLGGKRLRPVLTLLAADAFGGDYKAALNAALSIEVFHNFSLVHDDIMDGAPFRRGYPTVHEKWDVNTGILSGDAMLIMAYQLFEHYPANVFLNLAKLFSKTALQVCEGQQYDIDFETQTEVTMAQYLKMIAYKTAVLLAAAMQMGAIVAEAEKTDQEKIYNFGLNLGIAFQLQDDYLDVFGDPETFGKQLGGDILEQKKTFLYLKTLERLQASDRADFLKLTLNSELANADKINQVKDWYIKTGAATEIQSEIEAYTQKSIAILETVNIDSASRNNLRNFSERLMKRSV